MHSICITFTKYLFKITTLSIFLCIISSGYGVITWCYDGQGGSCVPKNWSGSCTTGKSQSPINIVPSNTTKSLPNRTLIFSSEYYTAKKFTILNTARYIAIDPYFAPGEPRKSDYRIKGTGWTGTNRMVEIHIHWPSEHMIKGERSLLEMELLHVQDNGTGLGVLSILFSLSKKPSKVLAPIVSLLPNMIDSGGAPRQIPTALNISAFFPTVWDIFRYNGSLTFPGCRENVMWSVFTQKMPISQQQADAFAQLHDENKNPIKKNYRPLQTAITKERKRIYWMKIDKKKMRENTF